MKDVAERGLAARALAKQAQRSQRQTREAQQGIEKAKSMRDRVTASKAS